MAKENKEGNKDKKNIGVITDINGRSINDISTKDRKKWARNLCEKLEEIDGVVSSFIDDHGTNSFSIAVEIKSTVEYNGYIIHPELRVLGKRIRKVVDEDKFASANIVENDVRPPDKKSRKYHGSKYYLIEVNYP